MKDKGKGRNQRHAPLGDQILASEAPKAHQRVKQRQKEERLRQEEESEQFVGVALSKKILDQAREQQLEVQGAATTGAAAARAGPRRPLHVDSDDEMDEADAATGFHEDPDAYYEHLDVDPRDERALTAFMAPEPPQRLTLADIIMSKIKEKETEIQSQLTDAQPVPPLDPKIIRVYQGVGKILSRYRSGKLPKAFKIIPSLRNWEEVLYVTQPETWTAASVYQATRVFVSNLNVKMCQRFLNLVLLPRVRDDIDEYKRLNFHLFMALKKALFKPAAFFKGILLPLCEAGDCTLREAVIVGSVLARVSIPVLHSSAALLKIAEMPYTGANSIFLKVLLDKKYALPYRVVDALVFHFYRFTHDHREMPVLWHQALLTFMQRYKEEVTGEQKEALLELMRAHTHPGITREIRREIVLSRSRDSELTFEKQFPAHAL
eukprot:m.482324 g.482324  ORF g.482324 m.482324 type:complete len:434 (-) comp22494_c0_seq1:18-1319(-)